MTFGNITEMDADQSQTPVYCRIGEADLMDKSVPVEHELKRLYLVPDEGFISIARN